MSNYKILFIRDSIINNKIDHKIILDFLNINNITCEKNMYGTILIINKLKKKHIENLYNLINKHLIDLDNINYSMENYNNEIKISKKKIINNNSENIIKYNKLNVNFNEFEKTILENSLK